MSGIYSIEPGTVGPDVMLAVKNLLLADDAVKFHVASQVFSVELPQGIKPGAILLNIVSERVFNDLGGSIGTDQAMLQIDAYGRTLSQARQIAFTVWQVMDGFAGVVAGVHIKAISRATGVRIGTDRVLRGTDEYRFIAGQDFRVTYNSCETVTEE